MHLVFLMVFLESISYVLSLGEQGSIPIARSINPDDSVDLTRLSYLNSTKKRLVLDGSWTVGQLDRSLSKLVIKAATVI